MLTNKFAVPYYGRVHRAKSGYEKIYFIVEADGGKEEDLNVRLGVWDNKNELTLAEWLKSNGVKNLVCREEPETFLKVSMAGSGIKILDSKNSYGLKLMKTLLV